jgi:hypothetical protein
MSSANYSTLSHHPTDSVKNVLAAVSAKARVYDLKQQWWRLDVWKTGELRTETFFAFLSILGISMSPREADDFLEHFAGKKGKGIQYEEFCRAVREFREAKQAERRELREAAKLEKFKRLYNGASSQTERYRLDTLRLRLEHEKEAKDERQRREKKREAAGKEARIHQKVEELYRDRALRAQRAEEERRDDAESSTVASELPDNMLGETISRYMFWEGGEIPQLDSILAPDGTFHIDDLADHLRCMGVLCSWKDFARLSAALGPSDGRVSTRQHLLHGQVD